MSLSFRQIRYFLATAKSGKISQAAMDLHVSQPAITTAIKGLETIIGARLFERKSHGVQLTYEGNQFLHHARHIMASVDEAIRFPSRANAAVEGTLNLAVSYTVAGYFLPAHLARFSRRYPNINVRLVEADRVEIEEGIIDRTYDLAVMLTSNLVNHMDILTETLIRSRRRLWTSADHALVNQPTVTLDRIKDEPYILLTVDEASINTLRYWNQSSHRPNVVFRTSSIEAVRSFVANGMGISILSDMVYRPWSLEGHRLEAMALANDIPDMDVGLAWARNSKHSDAARVFCEFMYLALSASQPPAPGARKS